MRRPSYPSLPFATHPASRQGGAYFLHIFKIINNKINEIAPGGADRTVLHASSYGYMPRCSTRHLRGPRGQLRFQVSPSTIRGFDNRYYCTFCWFYYTATINFVLNNGVLSHAFLPTKTPGRWPGVINSSLMLHHEHPVHASLYTANIPYLLFLEALSLRYVATMDLNAYQLSIPGYERLKIINFNKNTTHTLTNYICQAKIV